MISNELLIKAISIAKEAHKDQLDKAGKPYIEHPIRVMNSLTTQAEKIVGILHDSLEDSELTLLKLREVGFPSEIIEALDALTKRRNEPYEKYIQRVISNSIATSVKISDMQDNMRIERIPNPTEKDYQRLKKYQKIFPRLLQAQQDKIGG